MKSHTSVTASKIQLLSFAIVLFSFSDDLFAQHQQAHNPIIFAEVSVRFSRIEDVDEALPHEHFRRAGLPWEAAFLAGKAFLRYRRSGGGKTSTMPDFFIGAHAAVAGLALLTRDRARFRTYLPTVVLITPDEAG